MSKPKFDPSKPFVASKPPFDPSMPVEIPGEQPAAGPPAESDDGGLGSEVLGVMKALGGKIMGARGSEMPASPRLEALGRGGGQGVSLGFQEEGSGLLDALYSKYPILQVTSPLRVLAHLSAGRPLEELLRDAAQESVKNENRNFGDVYREKRDDYRNDNATAQAAHPGYYLAGEIAGGAAVPVPGGAAAKGAKLGVRLARAAGQGAGLGAAFGLGNSNADLTQGQVGQAAMDAGAGALLGGVAGAGSEAAIAGVSKALGAIRARAAAGIKDAVEAEAAKNEALAAKNIASAEGSARSSVQSASRDVEVMAREAEALPDGDPAKQQLLDFLNSEDALKLRRAVALNKLKTAPDRIAEMNDAWKTVEDLTANKDASVKLMTNEGLRDAFRKHMAPRFAYMAKNAFPLALGALGLHLGGAEGFGIGGGLGFLYSLVRGSPNRTMANMMAKPAVRKTLWELVQGATGGAEGSSLLGRTAQQAAERGQNVIDLNSARGNPLLEAILQKVAAADPEKDRQNALASAQ
jgi:hypothetical protein